MEPTEKQFEEIFGEEKSEPINNLDNIPADGRVFINHNYQKQILNRKEVLHQISLWTTELLLHEYN